jgi:large subunit ribosomal protein L29
LTRFEDDAMSAAEVKKMSGEEIDVELVRLRRRIYDLRCQTVTEKIEDPSQFKKTKREVARLLTEQRAREMSAQGANA